MDYLLIKNKTFKLIKRSCVYLKLLFSLYKTLYFYLLYIMSDTIYIIINIRGIYGTVQREGKNNRRTCIIYEK